MIDLPVFTEAQKADLDALGAVKDEVRAALEGGIARYLAGDPLVKDRTALIKSLLVVLVTEYEAELGILGSLATIFALLYEAKLRSLQEEVLH